MTHVEKEKSLNGELEEVSKDTEKSERELKKEELRRKKNEKFLQKKQKLIEQQMELKNTTKKMDKVKIVETITYDLEHKPGDRKDVTIPLPNAYSPKYVEACWYDWWQFSNLFKPQTDYKTNNGREKFVICLPPPNVTGNLHLGHALTTAIQDCLIRWHRMKGHDTLYIPGSDHAGIATQVVVEKQMIKENPTRPNIKNEMGRQAFVNKIWEWKDLKGNQIAEQEKALGASLDWSREFFTMNKNFSSAVTEAFVRLFDEGLIYRSSRLVNWSCALKSAISDIEVEKKDFTGRTLIKVANYSKTLEVGSLVYFAYKVYNIDSNSLTDEIVVATTRLETMLGDTGIAVHPQDVRYSKYGSSQKTGNYKVVHPFFPDRCIPIVFDEAVDMNFGTGAVKITPAHDFDDFEIGKRHNLQVINIFTDEGYMDFNCGPFSGMHRFDARVAIEKELNQLGLFRDKKDHNMVIPFCSRSKDIIEPLLKPQWYLNCEEMAYKASEAVKSGALQLIPPIHEKTWYNWMNNIRDWCISRQLWWGHRIPAYRVIVKRENDLNTTPNTENEELWVSARDYLRALSKTQKLLNLKGYTEDQTFELVQDEDVLDTWFSSALAPFASLGWPDTENSDFIKFFPNSLLETGHDIIFFWVARMVFMSQKLLGKLPFKQVYLHAMVRDSHGRKMSKSLGNIIDPLDVIKGVTLEELHAQLLTGNLEKGEIEKAKQGQKKDYPNGIPECGTDALRFALCAYTSQGKDINLDVMRIVGYRHFCNKVWNSAKFILNTCETYPSYRPIDIELPHILASAKEMDRWILLMLKECVINCNKGFSTFEFPQATTALFNFWLYHFCDIYIEYAKLYLYDKIKNNTNCTGDKSPTGNYKHTILSILVACLSVFLKLLHPFMPFLTEELYQRTLPLISQVKYVEYGPEHSISIATYPIASQFNDIHDDSILNETTGLVMNIVKGIRNVRHEYNILKQTLKVKILLNIPTPTSNVSKEGFDQDTLIKAFMEYFDNYKEFIVQMTNLNHFEITSTDIKASEQKNFSAFTLPPPSFFSNPFNIVVYTSLEGLIDLDKEKQKLYEKKEKLTQTLYQLNLTVSDPNHNVEKVGEKIYQLNYTKLNQLNTEIEELNNRLQLIDL